MIAKSCSLVAMAAGLATGVACGLAGVAAEAQGPAPSAEARPAGHLYINMRTGERVYTLSADGGGGGGVGGDTQRAGPGIFLNNDYITNGNLFWSMDDPARTGSIPPFGTEGADWGDMPFDMVIDGIGVAYATDSAIEIAPVLALPGFTLINWFYDCDNGRNDPSAVPTAAIMLTSAPAAFFPTGYTGWFITYDFAPNAFAEFGDTDGTAASPATGQFKVNGPFLGCDKDDTDGTPWSDFGWSYTFIQNQTASRRVTGPYLVLPQYASASGEDDLFVTGGGGNAHGVADDVDWYTTPTNATTLAPRSGHLGTFNFGGWPPNPYASLYIGLYGYDPCALADYNNDAIPDILDILDLFSDFSICQGCTIPAACPPAVFAKLDRYNPDGCVDILDLLEFFSLFGHCF